MNKEKFLRDLEYLLGGVSQEEREEALSYYRDYFDEAGPEREADILMELQSPERVAAEIKQGLEESKEAGEFTERGFRDERFEEEPRVPDQYAEIVSSGMSRNADGPGQDEAGSSRGRRKKDRDYSNRRNAVLILILFFVFGIPAAGSIISAGFSVVAGIIAGVFGIVAGMFGLIAGGFAAVIGLLAAGVWTIVQGAVNMAVPAIGMMVIGWGFLMIAAAALLLVLVKWGCTTAVPGLIHFCVDLVKRIVGWFCTVALNVIHRILGKGGESR